MIGKNVLERRPSRFLAAGQAISHLMVESRGLQRFRASTAPKQYSLILCRSPFLMREVCEDARTAPTASLF